MQRRYFLSTTGQALAFAVAAHTARAVVSRGQQPSQASSTELEQRVASVLQAFDSQGNHRTGTAVDSGSAEWLAAEVRGVGIRPSLEPFGLSRMIRNSHMLVSEIVELKVFRCSIAASRVPMA
jgi:hypothetical protein